MKRLPVILILLFILSACKTKQQTLIEQVFIEKTDTVNTVRWRLDSVVVHDSVVTFIKGDTVQIERWHTAYREKVRTDTVEKIITRTEYRTKTEIETVIKEVNVLRWWQKALMWIGGVSLLISAGFVLWKLKR